MFVGEFKSWRTRRSVLPAAVVRAFEALEKRNLDELENGRHELDEEGMFLLVQDATTREIADSNPEAHREHADIQIVLKGAERFGFAPADAGLVALEDRLDSGDIAFYPTPLHEGFIDLVAGQYVIVYPGDLHRPCGVIDAPAFEHKAVLKIHRRLLGL